MYVIPIVNLSFVSRWDWFKLPALVFSSDDLNMPTELLVDTIKLTKLPELWATPLLELALSKMTEPADLSAKSVVFPEAKGKLTLTTPLGLLYQLYVSDLVNEPFDQF